MDAEGAGDQVQPDGWPDSRTAKRHIVVAAVAGTAFRTLPVIVPDAVAAVSVRGNLLATPLLRCAFFADVVLLFSGGGPVRCAAPADFRQAACMGRIAGFDGLRALGVVLVLVVANVAFQAVTSGNDSRAILTGRCAAE